MVFKITNKTETLHGHVMQSVFLTSGHEDPQFQNPYEHGERECIWQWVRLVESLLCLTRSDFEVPLGVKAGGQRGRLESGKIIRVDGSLIKRDMEVEEHSPECRTTRMLLSTLVHAPFTKQDRWGMWLLCTSISPAMKTKNLLGKKIILHQPLPSFVNIERHRL